MARSCAMSLWGRLRLASRTTWMRSRKVGSVSWRKAWSSLWTSGCGKWMRITSYLPSRCGLFFLLHCTHQTGSPSVCISPRDDPRSPDYELMYDPDPGVESGFGVLKVPTELASEKA